MTYEKHKAEMLALARFDHIFAINGTLLRDNFEFIDKWLEALSKGRSFSFRFEKFFINEDETYKLSNLNLINKIVGLNYQLRRNDLDLDNLYKSYWEMIFKIDSMQDKQQREIDLQKYHETIFQILKQFKNNYEPLMNNLVDVLANVKVAANVRFHSLFGYLNLLLMDIFPKMSHEAI